MKQKRNGGRRLLALLLAVCLLGGLTANVFAFDNVVASGTCGAEGDGSNLSWKFTSDGTLTITGSGAMKDYERYGSVAPWLSHLKDYSEKKTLVLDDRITHIGNNAFFYDDGGAGLSGELHLPESLVSIGNSAFQYCSELTGTLTLPSGLTTIGSFAFCNCLALTGDLVLPEGCTSIGMGAFTNCTGLTGKLQTPSGLKTIEQLAFTGAGFTKAVLNDGLESIGARAFMNCSALTGSLRIPDSVTTIGAFAFASTSDLMGVTLSSALKEIGESAFMDSGIAGTLIIPEGVEKIEETTFQRCKNLTKVKLPKSLTSIGRSAFGDCSGMQGTLRIPDAVTTIGDWAFSDCSGLSGIVLPFELSSIGDYAFWGCSGLQGNIVFGLYVVTVGLQAFDGCNDVNAFCFKSNAPSTASSFPRDTTLRYCVGTSGWTNSEQYDANAGTWHGYKLETWDGHVTKPIDEDQAPDISDTSIYDEETLTWVKFRIYAAGGKRDATVNGFKVTIDGNTYRNIKDNDYGYEEIRAEKRKDDTGKIVISREGYYTYEMPAQWASIVEYVLMTPKTVTAPFAQTLYSRRGELLVSANWIDVYQDTPDRDPHDPVNLYAQINWNGHGAGKVWLQQGETKIELKNNEWTPCDTLGQLEPNKTVYLCAEAADGATTRARTQILIHEAVSVNLDIDPGSVTVSTKGEQKELDILDDREFELDFSDVFQGAPIKLTVGMDGTFKGVLGGTLAQGTDVEAAYGTMKDAFKRLKDPEQSPLNRGVAKDLESFMKENGFMSTPRNSKLGVSGKIQLMGIFTGSFRPDRKANITELELALVGTGKLSYTYQTYIALPTGPLPAYFKVELESKLQLMLKEVYDEGLKEMVPCRAPLNFSMELSAEVGPGWEGYLSCGVKGTGTVKFYGYVPIVPKDITATLAAKIGLVGTLHLISGEWEIVKTKEMTFWKDGWLVWEEYEPKDDSLIQAAFIPDTNMQVMTFALAKQADGTIAQNVSGYSAPDMVQLTDGRLLAVWTADVSGRKLSDRGGIYYSVRDNNGVWSSPLLVWNDGTSACAPVLQTLDGGTWVVWQNNKEAQNTDDLTSISFDSLAENCDIAAARFDSDSNKFTDAKNIGTSGYSYAPQLSLQNSAVTAAWKQAVVSENTTTETVWTSSFTSSTWSNPKQGNDSDYPERNALPSTWEDGMTEPAASARQCFSTDSYDAVIYTAADENGVNQVYALWNDGYGWGEPFALTAVQSSGGIGGFRAVIDEDEQIHILANVLTLDDDGKYQSADLTLFEKKLGADLTVSEADYVRRTLIPGRTVTLTAEVTNNGTKTVEGVHISALNGETLLTEADFGITLLPGQTKTAYLNYDLPESSTLTGVTLRVVPQEEVADADESDNTAQCAFQLVDLSVEDVTSIAYDGNTILQAQIVNRGQKSSEATSVVFRLGSPEGDVLGTVNIAAIEAGGLEQAELTLNRTLDERAMIYVETPVQSDENLYGNNSNYGVVMGVPAQAQTSSVSESYKDGTLTLDVSLEHISTDVRAIAAAYDAEGRLLQTAAQTGTDGSLALELRTGVEPASWKLFLLDAKTNQPICDCMEG